MSNREACASHRRGFTMLTTLWVITVASIVAMSGALAGRDAIGAARNRVAADRAYWRAEGCLARARSAADEAMRSAPSIPDASNVWRRLDRIVASSPALAECDVTLEAAGTRLDVNSATADMLARAFDAAGFAGIDEEPARLADGIVAARDSMPFADVRELARVADIRDVARIDSLLSVEPGRVSLATAPYAVLMAIPGFTPQTAAVVIAAREEPLPLRSLTDVLGRVGAPAADSLVAAFPDAERVSAADPDAWIVRSQWRSGLPVITVDVGRRFARSLTGVVVTSSRIER